MESSTKCSSPKQNNSSSTSKEEIEIEIPKVHLFEKPLTPSDVGKLNRLVIPKQNAEKYFPLNELISDSSENGFVLRFEDELGKLWKFRYSYWNSSQSYVLTKGWSRFVKEKKLDAGDVVLFERHRVDCDRQFIGCRRKNGCGGATGRATVAPPGDGGWNHVYGGGSQQTYRPSAGGAYQNDFIHAGKGVMQNQTTNTRRQVRLFGVNLECEVDDSSSWSESSTPDGSSSSNHHQEYYQGQASQHHHQYQGNYSNPRVVPAASSYNNKYNYHNNMVRSLFY
ncbi:unnamed protein product [Withania somnifera]